MPVDLDAGNAHWFALETRHDWDRPTASRRADDLRALVVTCLIGTDPDNHADTRADPGRRPHEDVAGP